MVGKTEYYEVLGIILPRFNIVVPVIAYTWFLSWQTSGSIKFPSKVFWRGSFWPALELQRNTRSYYFFMDTELPNGKNIKISIDDSAELLRGGSRIFLGGGALVSCSNSTPINHIVFFLQSTSCIRKLQVISGGKVRTPCTLPLDLPLELLTPTPFLEILTTKL